MKQPTNGHDPIEAEQIRLELEKFSHPDTRIAFLKEHNIEHHFLISGPEMTMIQSGTSQLHGEIRNWRTLSQALFGVANPEEALEFAKTQKRHRDAIMDDRLRYRNALLEVMKRIKADNPEAWEIAFKAINPPKS